MASVPVDTLTFTFPADWRVSKYDEWTFYQQHWMRMRNGIRAVDLLAVGPGRTVWLIEAKDYRVHPRAKASEVSEECACKVFDTLAAMLPARVNGRAPEEVAMAATVLDATQIRVVLHIEQPAKHSPLRPRAIDLASVRQKLRSLLRAVDPHALVTDRQRMLAVGWTVT